MSSFGMPEDFSPEDMEQMQHFGQALAGEPTDFDEEVEHHLRAHEASYKKMKAAQSGGSPG